MIVKINTIKHLEELVLLAQVDRLLPAVVALVQVGTDAPKLNQFVLLEALRQRDVVKVVKCVNGSTQTLVIFFFNEKIVQSLIDRLVVVVLHHTIILILILIIAISSPYHHHHHHHHQHQHHHHLCCHQAFSLHYYPSKSNQTKTQFSCLHMMTTMTTRS